MREGAGFFLSKCQISSNYALLTHEPFGQSRGRLVHWTLAVLVLDGDESAALEQILGAVLKLPEARVVQRGVAVLVDKVHVGLVFQELQREDNYP